MKKISILSLHLGHGGIEKAVTDLANNLCNKYEVKIVSVYKTFETLPFQVDSRVKIQYLMDGGIALKTDIYKKCIKQFKFIKLFSHLFKDYKFNIFKLIKDVYLSIAIVINKRLYVKKYLKNSNDDVIISTRDYLNKLLGKYGKTNQIKIGWEHNHHNGNKKYFNKICNSVKKLNYFVLVSKELFKDYDNELHNSDCKCVYIPNMIDFKENTILSKLDNNNLINISRFSSEKGLFDLIDVASILKKNNVEFKLNIVGDGSLKESLINYSKEMKTDDVVNFLGYKNTDEIDKLLSNTSLYVMTSFTESFGIVLLEAFSHGVPAIAFSSAQGANELINNDVGFIIKDRNKNEMAKVIKEYLTNKSKFINKQNLIVKKAKEFSFEVVIKKWCDIIDKSSF